MIKYIILCVIFTVSQARVVPFLKPCEPTDSDCILKSSNTVMDNLVNGYEPLGIPSINPYVYNDTITMDTDELKLSLNNVVTNGLSKCTLSKHVRDIEANSMFMVFECSLKIVGNYDIKGKILNLDLDENGPFELKGDKIRFTLNLKLDKIEENGVEHYKVTNFDCKYELLSKFVLHLGNLFNGDQSKAASVEKVIEENTNTLLMSENIGRPLGSQLLTPIVKYIGDFIRAVPINEFEIL